MAEAYRYLDLVSSFTALYQQEEYQRALEMLERDAVLFPEGEPIILAWESAMLARTGQVKEAIDRLQAAYDRGYWYHESALVQDPDFAALQDQPRFQVLLEQFRMRCMIAVSQSLPAMEVIAPEQKGRRPLLLALHGNFSNAATNRPYWTSVVERGWLLALPQSSQPTWVSGSGVWDDAQKSLAEMQQHLDGLKRNYPVDTSAIVAAGFSMGGQIALRMALSPEFRLRGAVLVDPWVPEEAMAELVQLVKRVSRPAPPIYLNAGKENSEMYHMAVEVSRLLAANDIRYCLEGNTNTQHGFPPGFDSVLARALAFVMGGFTVPEPGKPSSRPA